MNFKNKMRLVSLVLLVAVSLMTAPRATADGAAAALLEAASPSAMTTVLPLSEAQALFKFYFDADSLFGKQHGGHRKKETYWIPTNVDVAQAESALADYARTNTNVPFITKPQKIELNNYFRQYAGVMRGEKKCILINAFAASSATNFVPASSKSHKGDGWHDRAVLVYDGGPFFFHATYNPTKRQVENVQFNGIG